MKTSRKYAKFGMNYLWSSLVITTLYLVSAHTPSNQALLIVQPQYWGSSQGKLTAFHYINRHWHKDFTITVSLGSSGVKQTSLYLPILPFWFKHEGDRATPAGNFKIVSAFGNKPSAQNNFINFRQTSASSRYSDDSFTYDYNNWSEHGLWGEHMLRDDGLYDQGFELDYNHDPELPFHGSAIFIHIWRSKLTPTAGCIAMNQTAIQQLYQWLSKHSKNIATVSVQQW